MLVWFSWELLLENNRWICNILKDCLVLRKKKVSHLCFALWSESLGALCKRLWAELLKPRQRRAALLVLSEEETELQRNLHQQTQEVSLKMLVFWDWVKVAWERSYMTRLVACSSSLWITRLSHAMAAKHSSKWSFMQSYNCLYLGRLTLYWLEHSQWLWHENMA